ncbi:MAG: type I methionyl aminopeptidase [Candidatus Eisenbacteria bacterium]|nr:type I methionyl aminopeptidase [Candidatus Eisenbacteria bacterium]MCC7141921.1 type I methionyl aminopeptidase [Candidatus Eisenbacteria bacterium]
MIRIRRPDEVAKIRASARIVAEALDLSSRLVRPGLTTRELDQKIEELIRSRGATPSFIGYHGYPAASCLSVNAQVVHAIPGDYVLREGDIIGVDVGAYKAGYHGDGAFTFPVGEVSADARRLMEVTRECLRLAIEAVRPGNRVGAIGHAVQTHAEKHGFGVVRELVGHGIGERMHEEPQVPNYGRPDSGPTLRPGMVIAIEPMINLGTHEVETLEDEWTVVTRDGSLSAHYEHTVLVTETGSEILTVLDRAVVDESPLGSRG